MYTWEELEQFVNNCRACPLCRTRKHPVMGRGDHKGKLMLVAEAPGRRMVGKKRREKVEKNKKSTCIFTRYPV